MPKLSSRILPARLLLLGALASTPLTGQSPVTHFNPERLATSSLPDSPGAVVAAASSSLRPSQGDLADLAEDAAARSLSPRRESALDPDQQHPNPGQPGSPLPRHASSLDSFISAGQVAPPQSARDKILGSLRNSVTSLAITSNVLSAGYSHLSNGTPNFGTDGNAFAERFGATMVRGTSQSLFGKGLIASVLHEDSRYYQLGRKHRVAERIAYAATRPIITRTDGGRKIPNLWLLSGNLAAAAITPAYYPPLNTGTPAVFKTWGTSLGGSAVGYGIREFLPDALEAVHWLRGK